jgi:hypothetical protein
VAKQDRMYKDTIKETALLQQQDEYDILRKDHEDIQGIFSVTTTYTVVFLCEIN